MKATEFTNEQYIPLGKLEFMDYDIFLETKEYRKNFIQVISFGEEYSKLVDTLELLKKRYIKNVGLSRVIDIDATDNDIVLELSKKLVIEGKLMNIPKSDTSNLLKLYREEGNDLTIITTWIIKNISKYLYTPTTQEISRIIPEVSKNDEKFITISHDKRVFYSISDYMKDTNCSYETARSGLERLTKLELFTKQKRGKKFVYQPTNKLKQIIKGDL